MNETRPEDDGTSDDARHHGRVWWHSRRGLRELDLLLLPFIEDIYDGLDDDLKSVYIRLLDNEDTELLVWFTGRGVPLDPELVAMVERIKSHHRMVS
ncbi:MAG TPA: succinate dehydrogenase assembly factor 2 [Pseudomonadales bacterium]|nr:succinate dehydrogenase assembly factor 2 [Pseudomonadales bacterium]